MVKEQRIGRNLTEGPIFKQLMLFAIPMILSSVVQQCYSMVDLMVIGKFVGSTGTVGVSVGGEIADLCLPFSGSFASAAQIYIAQLVGARDEKRIKETIGTLFSFSAIVSLAAMISILVLRTPLLNVLHCPQEAFGQAMDYLVITTLGLPFVFGYNAVCGVLRGMGESKKPLIFVSIAATVNIFADILLVRVFKLEAAGTAIATVLSQMGSFIAASVYMYRHRENFDFELKLSFFKVKKDPLLIIIKLGIPSAIRSIFVHYSKLWVNSNVNQYGLVVSATNSVGNKIQALLNIFSFGVETACSSMIAQNLGARKYDRAKKALLYTFGFAMTTAIVSSALALLIPRQLYSLFTNDPEVIEYGVTYLRIIVMAILVAAVTSSFQTMVIGSGFASMNFMLGILDGVVCRIGFSLLFLNVFNMGAESYFWGTSFSRTIPGIICLVYFFSGKWRTRKLLSEKK